MTGPRGSWLHALAGAVPRPVAYAVAAPVLLPARVLGLLEEVGELLADLRGSAARVRALLDELADVPAAVSSLVGDVDGVLTQVRPLPGEVQRAVQQVDQVLDAVRPLPGRAGQLIDDVEVAVAGVQPTLAALQQAQALLAALSALDPQLAQEAARLVHLLPPIMERVDQQVLPAVAVLQGLVPVVAKLSVTVDSLDHQVVEVGSLLGGIPGASRLVRRGGRDTRPRGPQPEAGT